MEYAQLALGAGLGVALAAACGFRVFVPMLVVAVATKLEMVPVQEHMAWVGSWWTIVALATATVVEIAAYYVPWVDNLLDTIGVPAASVAGVLVAYLAVADAHPAIAWSIAAIAGGGTAATVKVGMTTVRGASTAASGGTLNWLVASIESGTSTLLAVLAVVIPVVIGALTLVGLGVLVYWVARRRRRARLDADRAPDS